MRRGRLLRGFAVAGVAGLGLALLPAAPVFAETLTVPFSCTEGAQSWVVPAGVTEVTIELWGAQGGHGVGSIETDGAGGLGGHVTGTIAVTPVRPWPSSSAASATRASAEPSPPGASPTAATAGARSGAPSAAPAAVGE